MPISPQRRSDIRARLKREFAPPRNNHTSQSAIFPPEYEPDDFTPVLRSVDSDDPPGVIGETIPVDPVAAEAWKTIVYEIVEKVRGRLPFKALVDSLVGFGCVGMMDALRAFDSRGGWIEFPPMCRRCVRRAIFAGLRSEAHDRMIRRKNLEDSKANRSKYQRIKKRHGVYQPRTGQNDARDTTRSGDSRASARLRPADAATGKRLR